MLTKAARWGLRFALLTGLCVVLFYLGRPLYWKVSATIHEIQEKNYDPQAVKEGISELMHAVGWAHGESTSKDTPELHDKLSIGNAEAMAARKLAQFSSDNSISDMPRRQFI
eukprot:c16426_g1_i1 orf=230-565(-)